MDKKEKQLILRKERRVTKKEINHVFNKYENVECDKMINENSDDYSYIVIKWSGSNMKKNTKTPEITNFDGLIQAIIPVFKNMIDESNKIQEIKFELMLKKQEDKFRIMLDESNKKLKTEIFDEINPRFDAIENDIKILKSDVAELKSDVTQLKSDVAELKSDVTQLKSDVAELKSDVT
ncbi:hypothetical protein, partial [Mycoplasma elephantis]|uniref:hypothetical protein n=1 Tax=Mycoplasma elephantis TaxID=114882 RepID=UPI000A06BFAE